MRALASLHYESHGDLSIPSNLEPNKGCNFDAEGKIQISNQVDQLTRCFRSISPSRFVEISEGLTTANSRGYPK
jgi:hypothetical protein